MERQTTQETHVMITHTQLVKLVEAKLVIDEILLAYDIMAGPTTNEAQPQPVPNFVISETNANRLIKYLKDQQEVKTAFSSPTKACTLGEYIEHVGRQDAQGLPFITDGRLTVVLRHASKNKNIPAYYQYKVWSNENGIDFMHISSPIIPIFVDTETRLAKVKLSLKNVQQEISLSVPRRHRKHH